MYCHIVASIHDSRTSKRMIEYNARSRRFNGEFPFPIVRYLTDDEDVLIAKTVLELTKELDLQIIGFNLCLDHMHLVLECEPEEISKIMHRIKGRTARVCNIFRQSKGINPLGDKILKDKSTPFWSQKYHTTYISSISQLMNTINYVYNNRVKHQLPKNPELEEIIHLFRKDIVI